MKKIFVITILLVSVAMTNAQELTRSIFEFKTHRALIREINVDKWLFYCDYQDCRPTFCIVDETGPITPMLWGDECVIVNDFEIIDGEYVFFCGERISYDNVWIGDTWVVTQVRNALFGYFEITSLLSTPLGTTIPCTLIEYFPGVDLMHLDKIEVLPVVDGIHLFMTGSTQTNQGCLVDAAANAISPSSWDFQYTLSYDGEKFDDIALLDNYIVVTSRQPAYQEGYINTFSVPSSYSVTTFGSALYRGMVDYSVDDTLLVAKCEVDTFATGTFSFEKGGIVMSGYKNTMPIHSVVINNFDTMPPVLQLRDIRYNKYSRVLDVLQNVYYDGEKSSIIWHIDQPLGWSGVSTNCHLYHNYTLHSIACLINNPNNTIAAGQTSDYWFAVVPRCLLGITDNCTKNRACYINTFLHELKKYDWFFDREETTVYPESLNNHRTEWPMVTECDNKKNK